MSFFFIALREEEGHFALKIKIMAAGKWIGGFLGFITAGPLGALAGYALGSLFDKGLDEVNKDGDNQQYGNAYSAYSGQSDYQSGFQGQQGYGGYSQQQAYEGNRNSFMFSLLVLSSYIINADGKIMHSEMELVRRFLAQNFGETAKQQGEEILLKLFEQQKRMGMAQYRTVIQDSCKQIRSNMLYEQRLQLLNFLVLIAQADGVVTPQEVQALNEIAIHMGLSTEDVDQMLNMHSGSYYNSYDGSNGSNGSYGNSNRNSLEDAYRVLGVSPSATNDEVKAAYRKMALKHHPDKVAALGEDVRKAAEKKFQEINDAKDRIYKARGMG